MTPIRRATLLGTALAFAVALAGGSAHAGGAPRLDLTGTWTGSITCKGFFGGTKDKFTISPTMKISQAGIAVAMELDTTPAPERYTALANPDAKKPEKGELAIIYCGTDDQVGVPPDFDEIGRITVSTKFGKVKASFKGTSIFSDYDDPGPLPAGSYTCKWKYTRVSDASPGLALACNE